MFHWTFLKYKLKNIVFDISVHVFLYEFSLEFVIDASINNFWIRIEFGIDFFEILQRIHSNFYEVLPFYELCFMQSFLFFQQFQPVSLHHNWITEKKIARNFISMCLNVSSPKLTHLSPVCQEWPDLVEFHWPAYALVNKIERRDIYLTKRVRQSVSRR